MPKLPSIPRLSIVVPVTEDTAQFESSLVSVLENRPLGCEIIVAHDGSYDDPFDLGDEVRFIAAESAHLVDLVNEAAQQSRGRFVHVLCEGVCATANWVDAALEKFEHADAGIIAPVIRDTDDTIVAAGWQDTTRRLCSPAAAGDSRLGRHTAARIGGAYLQASFWRREVLRSMIHAFGGRDTIEASYAYCVLARTAGWRTVLATECNVRQDHDVLCWDSSSVTRGKRLSAIKHAGNGIGWGTALGNACKSGIANLLSPAGIAESVGLALAPTAVAEMRRRLHADEVTQFNESGQILSMQTRTGSPTRTESFANRRAA